MSMFTLAILCLTTSNMPWFMDLTFQVPIQYCSLQHRISLPPPVTSTTGCFFCFGSISPFFLELFLHWSPVTYWAPINRPGDFIFQCIIFFAFSYCSWGSQDKSTEVVCYSLLQWTTFFSELSTMTCPIWVALHGMAHSFIELDKAVVHVIRLVSFLLLWFSLFLPPDG